MVSVCMATKNGSRYVGEQIDSILSQLGGQDELIISDDCSTDETVKIIETYSDNRIKLIKNKVQLGVAKNFENSLIYSKGDIIFLADQDDVWLPEKVQVMKTYLRRYDLVIHDCEVRDSALRPGSKSFFDINNSGKGLMKNILKNSYMGCCMAFKRNVLNKALPFPHDIPVHDFWIGLIGEFHFKVHFITQQLMLHRRHSSNVSTTGQASLLSIQRKVKNRYCIIKNLLLHRSYAG